MIYFLIAIAIVALIGVPFAIWYEKAKKELEEADKEQEDEKEEDDE